LKVNSLLLLGDAESIFEPLVHLECWNVRRGVGSFITFEFGEPRLEIREPKAKSRMTNDPLAVAHSRRLVTVVGRYHFWVQYCDWVLSSDGLKLASSSSSEYQIEQSLARIDGQKLLHVRLDAASGTFEMKFDLGAILAISPGREFLEDDQWSLFLQDGTVYSLTGRNQLTKEHASG
jgi:hypothetical protein